MLPCTLTQYWFQWNGKMMTAIWKTLKNFFSPIYTQYFCTQYWDKKTFFIQYFFSCANWKYSFLDNYAYWNLVLKYFLISLKYFEEKNIFISQCCVQKYCVWRGPFLDIFFGLRGHDYYNFRGKSFHILSQKRIVVKCIFFIGKSKL